MLHRREVIGRRGRAIGVDMTPEMFSRARRIAKEHKIRNVEFRLGEIFRALKPGGRISICDIIVVKELTKEILEDEAMYAC